ncbi:MAG: hypothetical protein J0L53_02705 [Spirochaetes bacterium]|nr:hypothetical protein [Spirochaetota bacterium]
MKKNKKDLFRKAVADNLNETQEESSELGDFVSDMKRSRDDAKAAEETAGNPPENKNDLPEQKEEKKSGSAMESRLKRLTSGGAGPVQPAAFADDDEPPRWRRFAVYGVAAFLVLSLLYWAIFSPGHKPTIYLSNTAIEETGARNLNTTNLVFPRNKTLYLLFSSGGRLGQDKLITKLTEVYADSSNMMKEESVAQIEGSVKSNWRYFTAQFQKENFDHTGRFRIHVLSPNGEILASQEFRIQ